MKKLLVSLFAMVLVISFTACDSKEDDDDSKKSGKAEVSDSDNQDEDEDEDDDNKDSKEDSEEDKGNDFGYSKEFVNEHLKGDYSITYKMTSSGTGEETESNTITMMKNSEGYYLYLGEDTGILYIKNGNKYDTYYGNDEEGFTLIPGAEITEKDLEGTFEGFTLYSTAYTKYEDEMNKKGSKTIAGRDCDVYEYVMKLSDSSVKAVYCIDKKTGICMKYSIEGKDKEGTGNYEFECIEFKTSGVNLPKHD